MVEFEWSSSKWNKTRRNKVRQNQIKYSTLFFLVFCLFIAIARRWQPHQLLKCYFRTSMITKPDKDSWTIGMRSRQKLREKKNQRKTMNKPSKMWKINVCMAQVVTTAPLNLWRKPDNNKKKAYKHTLLIKVKQTHTPDCCIALRTKT